MSMMKMQKSIPENAPVTGSKPEILVEMMNLTKAVNTINDNIEKLMDLNMPETSTIGTSLLESVVQIKSVHAYLNYLYSNAD